MDSDVTTTDELVPLDALNDESPTDEAAETCRWPYLHRPVTSTPSKRPSRSRWGSRTRPDSEVSGRR